MLACIVRLCREPGLILRRLIQCVFIWTKPTPNGSQQEAQLIVVQAAPDRDGNLPSETNITLAKLAQQYHEQLGIPIFPQAEVGNILTANGVEIIGTTKIYSTVPIMSAEYNNGSLGIAELQKKFCAERGWTKVLVVAYYPHAWRVIWTYERMGLEVIVPRDLPRMHPQIDMSQWRHRRATTSYLYELAARLFFLYKGYI